MPKNVYNTKIVVYACDIFVVDLIKRKQKWKTHKKAVGKIIPY